MPNQLLAGDSAGSGASALPYRAVPGDRGWGDGPPVPQPIDPFRDGPLPSGAGEPAPPGYVNRTASERIQGAVTGPDAIPLVYGKQMVEGRVISVSYDYYNRYRDFVIGVAAGEVKSVSLVDAPPGVSQADPAFAVYLGTLSQTPYPTLAYITARQYLMYWDGAHWIPYDPPVEMPTSWRFIVEGRLVTDTRTDVCDQVVDGKTRYKLNIAILTEASVEQWIETICTHFAAYLTCIVASTTCGSIAIRQLPGSCSTRPTRGTGSLRRRLSPSVRAGW